MARVEDVNPNDVTQEPQPQTNSQDVESVIMGIQDGLMILRNMFERTPDIGPEDKTRLDGVISEFKGLITENLSAAPGETYEKPPTAPEQVPTVVGSANVQAKI